MYVAVLLLGEEESALQAHTLAARPQQGRKRKAVQPQAAWFR